MNKKDLKDLVGILSEIKTKDSERILKKIQKELVPIKTRSRKGKGSALQKLVCEKISAMTGIPWGSSDEHLIRSREMGQHGVDVILVGEARNKFPFSIECKNTETFQLYKTIEQAVANVKDGDYWLVVHKKNGSKPIVVLDLDTFLEVYKKSP